ncbi:MAG TPA: uroporphyrinogen decarboxylase family protein [Candidatus Lokiarchaeia archaeon]|nr:uroporphyrinogen decarboxylase family protein [Candidatus Lokiarchaeia archaeon]
MPKAVDPRDWKSLSGNKWNKPNFMKALEFRNPDWIPCSMSMYQAVWGKYRDALKDITVRHPFVFGTFAKFRPRKSYGKPASEQESHTEYVDNWGEGWQTAKAGYAGQVVKHPLADWSAMASYKFPDPAKLMEGRKRHWTMERVILRLGRRLGFITQGSGERLFDRLYFLRGFDNLMRDFATGNPNLPVLIQRFTEHQLCIVKKYIEIRPDIVYFHTDIGMQDRLMISPRQFRQYIKPMYAALFKPLRDANIHVYLSSDGHLLEIVDDLIECGVSVHDPQLRANTLEGIRKYYKGKLCIDLDLDRQSFPFYTPEQLKKQVKDAVDVLSMPEGGLMIKAEISDPNTPLENIEAICEAFEEFCIH